MLNLVRTTSDNQHFRELVAMLDRELLSRYGEVQAQYDPHNKIENIKTVVVAYVNDIPVGCGCMKPVDIFSAEIKRMYVAPEHRGKGIAMAIMNEIEVWAAEQSYGRLVLETGTKQPEAIAVYRKCGFEPIENYGPYVGMELSVCMAKIVGS